MNVIAYDKKHCTRKEGHNTNVNKMCNQLLKKNLLVKHNNLEQCTISRYKKDVIQHLRKKIYVKDLIKNFSWI